jgi:hypothetical protein
MTKAKLCRSSRFVRSDFGIRICFGFRDSDFGFLSLIFVLLLLAGCSQPPAKILPTVHPASGKVVDRTGAPVAGGTVQFESLASQGQTALAEVGADGTFTLRTMVDGSRLDGVPPGPQRVTYMPRMTEDQSAAVPVTLTEQFEVKEGKNDFTIKLP